MSSAFIGLAQAIQALLLAGTPVADQVVRDRLRALPDNVNSAVVIALDKTRGQRASTQGGPTDWGTHFRIECYARCAADALPTEAVDPIVSATFARLAGVGSALALDVEDVLPDPDIEWDPAEANTPLVCATFSVHVIHRTQATQLVPWSS